MARLYLTRHIGMHMSYYTYKEATNNSQEDEPEPEEDVDLLVDDVERENAEPVKLLHRPGRTKLVECALCHLEQSNW